MLAWLVRAEVLRVDCHDIVMVIGESQDRHLAILAVGKEIPDGKWACEAGVSIEDRLGLVSASYENDIASF